MWPLLEHIQQSTTQFSSSIRLTVCQFSGETEDYLLHNFDFYSPTVTDTQHNGISQVLPNTESQSEINDHFVKHMHTMQACLFAFHNLPTGALKILPILAEFMTAPNGRMIRD